ncbi:MAG: AfsR/SARP family transcriptional regulator [Acidimicrobiales bacterium]
MLIHLLGPFEIAGLDNSGLGGRRQQSLLAILALRQGHPVTRDHLIDQMWDEPPTRAVSTVQVYVSQLRRALAPSPASIETTSGAYRLVGPPNLVDAVCFEDSYHRAEQLLAGSDPARLRRAVDLLGYGLGLFRGRVLDGFFDQPFARPAAVRLEELRLGALAMKCSAQLELGQHQSVLAELKVLVSDHPFQERFWQLLMVALYRAGRQGDALAAYQAARRVLVDQLGVEPGPALQQLEAAVLAQDASLWPSPTGSVQTAALHGPPQPGSPSGGQGADPPAAPTAPAPTSPRLRRGPWPVQTTGFIGRNEELGTLAELLVRHRTVTVLGPGGAGKTRLACEVVGQVAGRVSLDGEVFVDVASASDRDSVLAAFASALANNAVAGGIDQLAAELGKFAVLLVIDRCEHILATLAELLGEVLRRCPALLVLCTSREALGYKGETVWQVPPMGLAKQDGEELGLFDPSDAVQLFLDRASRFVRVASLTTAELTEISRLCQRLDGLPLAIEVAAGMTEAISLEDLGSHLASRLTLEASPLWSDDHRHRSLAATIEWSYNLLVPAEQALLRALGVFEGAFDIAALDEVCGSPLDGSPPLLLLGRLVARSLLPRPRQRHDRPYRLLDTIRLFAQGRLREDAEQLAAVGERHARYHTKFAQTAEQGLVGEEPARWLDLVDQTEPDLLATIAWWRAHDEPDQAAAVALVLGTHHLYRFRLAEASVLLGEIVNSASAPSPRLRAEAIWQLSSLAVMADDFDSAARYCDSGIELARQSGEVRVLGLLLARRAEVLRSRESDALRAHGLLDEALLIANTNEESRLEAEALRVLTVLMWDEGDHTGAERAARRWRAIGQHLGDARMVAESTLQLGGVVLAVGRYGEAEDHYREVAAFYATTGDPFEVAYGIYCRARAVHQQGRYELAVDLAAEALERFESIGDTWGRAIAHRALGQAAHALRDFETAGRQLRVALDLIRSLGYADDMAGTTCSLAALAVDLGDLSQGVELATEALEQLGPDSTNRHRGPLLSVLGLAALRSGDVSGARRYLAQAAEECERSGWAVAQEQVRAAEEELARTAPEPTATRSETPTGAARPARHNESARQ